MNPLKIARMFLVMLLVSCVCFPSNSQAQDSQTEELLEFLQEESKPAKSLLPPDVEKAPGFSPGQGDPVGEIQLTQGTVLVFHQGEKKAYTLKKGLKVYKEDTFITEAKSRMNLLLYDKSVLALAAQSKLVLNRSLYDPKEDSRDTEMQLLFGRVRCVVKKISTDPNYKVTTPTAVAGVRGTDFAMKTDLEETMVITGNNSILSFRSITGRTVMIPSNSVSRALRDGLITTPVHVGAGSIDTVMRSPTDQVDMSMPSEFN